MTNTQIYSATYSNVPVFEFVTLEGPIMRRKVDSWINATHILKIAKFPKAKRTRILEKDVQTGIHEKVQGGYGKFQGTYVPLNLGVDIAKNFGVYDVLRPIFEFRYIEGESETPPPAPKHNHASALNVAKRAAQAAQASQSAQTFKKDPTGEVPKKRGRPKRVTLSKPPLLVKSDITKVDGPNFGTFNPLRQDTIQDTPVEDLELAISDDDDERPRKLKREDDELLNTKELFGTPKDSFDRIINSHLVNQLQQPSGPASNLQFQLQSNSQSFDPYSLHQYHLPSTPKHAEDQYADYFSSLLSFFMDDTKIRTKVPENILNPPQPIAKLNINQAIDNDGNTIFHWACSMGNVEMIQFLIDTFEVNPDIRNTLGETPLMFLIKFNNSFELKNFPVLLGILKESILAVDNMGKTVLHHISQIEFDKRSKNKERFAKYYMDTLLEAEEKKDKELIFKFLNHQDSDGNTAFHITAYNLNKKLIKVFIGYHKYIDFTLRNTVSFTVEDYLALHNYVLRLESESSLDIASPSQSFESQLHNTKTAVNLQNSTSHLITERLTELAYTMDKELNEKDETILNFFKVLKEVNVEKLESQRSILKLFKMEYLIVDDEPVEDLIVDFKSDQIVQDEINRVTNDLCFQYLHRREEFAEVIGNFQNVNEGIFKEELVELIEATEISDSEGSQFELAQELNRQILKRRTLLKKLYQEQFYPEAREAPLLEENVLDKQSIIGNYPKEDKLNKYCRLLALACGMEVEEVESSIDLIEQSLQRQH